MYIVTQEKVVILLIIIVSFRIAWKLYEHFKKSGEAEKFPFIIGLLLPLLIVQQKYYDFLTNNEVLFKAANQKLMNSYWTTAGWGQWFESVPIGSIIEGTTYIAGMVSIVAAMVMISVPLQIQNKSKIRIKNENHHN